MVAVCTGDMGLPTLSILSPGRNGISLYLVTQKCQPSPLIRQLSYCHNLYDCKIEKYGIQAVIFFLHPVSNVGNCVLKMFW